MLPEPSGSLPEDRQPIMEEAMPERSEGSQQASQRVPEDDGETVNAGTKSTTPEVERDAPVLCRSGRAIFPMTVDKPPEIVAESSRDGLCYTVPLHSQADHPGESGGNRGRTRQAGCAQTSVCALT